jgi:hypothetical protein
MKTAILIVAAALVALIMVMWRYSPAQTPADKAACGSDVARFCKSDTAQGAMAVLACLQEHRDKISKSCSAVLAVHGK